VADRERLIDDLAKAILDGTPVDWRATEILAAGKQRGLVEDLRLISAIADLQREPAPSGDGDPPRHWGRLRLIERIGSGSFGDVYRAWDTRLEREVALKLIPVQGGPDDPRPDQILREGRLLARVRHPGVVVLHDAQQIGDRVGLVMEFIRGRTLEERLEQQGVFSPEETVTVGIELCAALSTVHAAGLLHRDIKANNVVKSDDGRIVLMDFGTGRNLGERSVGDLAGTPLYLAPEIFRREEATVRSDVYSLGVLLYRLLTGLYPVQAASLGDLRLAHQREDRGRVRSVRAGVPRALADVIERAIDPRPDRRYESAGALSAALIDLRPEAASKLSHARERWLERVGVGAAIALLVIVPVDRMGNPATPAALDAPASLLVGDVSGATGDSELEAMVQGAVTSELERSPFLNVFPAARLRESLARMNRSGATLVDEALGLEICAREGLTALVTASVTTTGGLYMLELRATHAVTGRVLARVQDGRGDRTRALEAAFSMSRTLRERLGESLASIQATSPPLEPVTTTSFEAVRHFTLGKRLYDQERARDALPHFQEAVRLDPGFAMAHQYAALSYSYLGARVEQREHLERAAALASDPASLLGPFERAKIQADYNTYLERYHEAAAHWREILTLRPADDRARANLGLIYGSLRQYGSAIEELEAAWRGYPHPRVRWMLADMYSASGRPEAAVELVAQHAESAFDWIASAKHLLIAGRREDAEGALEEALRHSRQDDRASWADLALMQADFHRSGGRFAAAEAALRQGLDRGGSGGIERLQLAMASLLVDSGRRGEAITYLRGLRIGLARNRIVHGVLAARAGDIRTAEAILQLLLREADERRAPRPDARVHQLRAEIALARNRAAEAHAHAGHAVRAFSTTWTLVTLARAQHAAGRIAEAAETWTTILDRPGERTIDWDAPAFSQVVLARYELARVLEASGRPDEARVRYDEFLRSWERADEALPLFVDARARRLAVAGERAESAEVTGLNTEARRNGG